MSKGLERAYKVIVNENCELLKYKKALEVIKIFLDKMGISFRFESDLIICIFINNKFDGTFTCDTQEEYELLKEVLL